MSNQDKEKTVSEINFQERELILKERELTLKEKEIESKIKIESKNSWLSSPLFVAGITAAIGLIGTGIGAFFQANAQSNTYLMERQKFEFSLVEKALETSNPKEAASRLIFLIDIGIVEGLDASKIRNIVGKPEQIPVLNIEVYLLAGTNSKARMFGKLRSELEKQGFRVLGTKQQSNDSRSNNTEVRYFNSSSKQKADIVAKFLRSYFSNELIVAKYYHDPSVKSDYVEVWLGQ